MLMDHVIPYVLNDSLMTLQKTPKDKKAAVVIAARSDEVSACLEVTAMQRILLIP